MLTNRINEVKNDAQATVENYPEPKQIKDDINSLKAEVASLTSRLRKDGSELAHRLEAELETQARAKYEYLKSEGTKQLDRVEAKVHAKPMQSIGIAFAAGFVMALLARR